MEWPSWQGQDEPHSFPEAPKSLLATEEGKESSGEQKATQERGKIAAHFWCPSATQSAQASQKGEREKKEKKKNQATFYKTLFNPKLQVPFVIQTPFFILLDRP